MKRTRKDLISKAYRRELATLHGAPRGFGGKGHRWADHVHLRATRAAVADAILDYGCGQNTLCEELARRGLRTRSYDPAIKKFSKLPKRSDMVVCCDVLEHVEPGKLESVLDHLAELTKVVGFFVVSVVETEKRLSDGRQAHISLHPREWWLEKLSERFRIVEEIDDPAYKPEKQVIVTVVPK